MAVIKGNFVSHRKRVTFRNHKVEKVLDNSSDEETEHGTGENEVETGKTIIEVIRSNVSDEALRWIFSGVAVITIFIFALALVLTIPYVNVKVTLSPPSKTCPRSLSVCNETVFENGMCVEKLKKIHNCSRDLDCSSGYCNGCQCVYYEYKKDVISGNSDETMDTKQECTKKPDFKQFLSHIEPFWCFAGLSIFTLSLSVCYMVYMLHIWKSDMY